MDTLEANVKQQSRRQRLRRGTSDLKSLPVGTESVRERDALRHLHAWIDIHQPAAIHYNPFATGSSGKRDSEPCNDAALAAFAQLCALRLNARRVLVTLLSTSVEYVLSEASRTTSLQYDTFEDPKDFLWIGTCSFPKDYGFNGPNLNTWRKARRFRDIPPDVDQHYYTEGQSPHWCIVNDVRSNPEYNQVIMAKHAPWLRFFCSIPMRSLNGSVIGTVSILDDKPRYGISAGEMLLLEDSADNIAEHLEASIVRSQRQRSERLIQALGIFNNGRGTLRDWWLARDDERIARGGRHAKNNADAEDQKDRADAEFGVQDTYLSDSTVSSRRMMHRQTSGDPTSDGDGNSVRGSPRSSTNGDDVQSVSDADQKAGSDDATSKQPSAQKRPPMFSADTTAKLERSSGTTRENARTQSQGAEQGVSSMDFDPRPKESDAKSAPKFIGESRPNPPRTMSAARLAQKQSSAAAEQKSASENTAPSQDVYARASNLMREALGAEGVVCVNGTAVSARIKSDKNLAGDSTSGATKAKSDSSGEDAATTTSDTDSDASSRAARLCKVQGFSTRNRSSLTGTRPERQRFGLTEQELHKLVKTFPRGKIFNFEESGNLYSSSGDESTSGSNEDGTRTDKSSSDRVKSKQSRAMLRLGKVMVGARSIAFYPIWDEQSESWPSCLFVWTTTPLRHFDSAEDLTYLAAFAHSLSAEIKRVETVASDTAKATFISSVSHELRSPLHGVMAGIEMILDSELTPFQKEMALNAAVAGRTLLDTINHILDFSKISNLTKTQRKEQADADSERNRRPGSQQSNGPQERLSVDLARLTEEVVETVVSGHRYQELSRRGSLPRDVEKRQTVESTNDSKSLCVTLDIENCDSWNIDMAPGVWTRIITNVLGNALKYTESGTVSVILSAREAAAEQYRHNGVVTLEVRDTGIGISQDFLAKHIYTPFKQADSHSAGTGLGLSIVKRIARDLRADLNVGSELGEGTAVSLTFATVFDHTSKASEDLDELSKAAAPKHDCGFHLINLPAKMEHQHSALANAVGKNAWRIASAWLGFALSSGLSLPPEAKDCVCVIYEMDLVHLRVQEPNLLSELLSEIATRRFRLIVFGYSASAISTRSLEGFPVKPIFVQQPLGPRKMLRAIQSAADLSTPVTLRDHALYNRAGPQTPLANLREEGREAESGTDYFPAQSDRQDQQATPQRSKSSPTLPIRQTSDKPGNTNGSEQQTSPASPAVMTPSVLAEQGQAGHDGQSEADSTVLLVEDNDVNMKLLQALMRKLHVPFQCASNGLEAFTIYSAHPRDFFLVLMDVDMPVMDGKQATAKIRELERKQQLPRTCVVALTGVTSQSARQECMDCGMDKFYTKPIRMKGLSALVTETRPALPDGKGEEGG